MRSTQASGSGPQTTFRATASSSIGDNAASKCDGAASSVKSGSGSAASAHTSRAVRRAERSSLAQQPLISTWHGRSLPPADR